MVTACLWLVLTLNPAKHALAQIGLNHETPDRAASNKELLVRRLEALRAAKSESAVQPAVHIQTEEPKQLFLDLTDSPTAVSDAKSAQATAATLNISMTSSPTQVVMRAVAWISIVLCAYAVWSSSGLAAGNENADCCQQRHPAQEFLKLYRLARAERCH